MIMAKIGEVTGDLNSKLANLTTMMETANKKYDEVTANMTKSGIQQEEMTKFILQQKLDLDNAQTKITSVETASKHHSRVLRLCSTGCAPKRRN